MTVVNGGRGSWIVLASLVLLLALAIVFLIVGLDYDDADPGQSMSTGGHIAMAFGVLVTLALGVGLMALVFYSNRKDRD
jgi:hypothetical protein